MSERVYKTSVLVLVLAVIAVGAWWKLSRRARQRDAPSAHVEAAIPNDAAASESPAGTSRSVAAEDDSDEGGQNADEPTDTLPAVIDLGMGKCIPCKMMKPILDELAAEYEGRARIEIIDIGEHPEAAKQYEVMLIPTQVFIDASGTELYRHEGFMPKEDIVAKLAEMGVE